MKKKKMAKWVTWYMATVMVLMGITPRVDAAFSPSEGLALLQSEPHSDLQKIQKVLESKMIRERLKALGFTQDEIQTRVSELNEKQIHQLTLKLDEMNVGGDGAEIVIIALLIGTLVVLIIYLSGHRVIIK
jgi:hypothetical protein